MKYLHYAFAFIVVLIILIAILFAPIEASFAYWGTTLWVCALVGCNWFASMAVLSGFNNRDFTGNIFGILPSISIVLFLYSLISLVLLSGTVLFDAINWRYQFGAQIVVFGILSIYIILGLFAFQGAKVATNSVLSKNDILKELRRIKRLSRLPSNQQKIQETINYVSLRLPHDFDADVAALENVKNLLGICDPQSDHDIETLSDNIRSL